MGRPPYESFSPPHEQRDPGALSPRQHFQDRSRNRCPGRGGHHSRRRRSSAAAGIVSAPVTFDVGGRPGMPRWTCIRQSCSPATSISTSWGNVSVSSAFRPMRNGSASGRGPGSGWMGRRRGWSPPRSGNENVSENPGTKERRSSSRSVRGPCWSLRSRLSVCSRP